MKNPFAYYQSLTDFDALCPELFSLPFESYIQACKDHILSIRIKAKVNHELKTIEMNAPFILEPKDGNPQRAVLMIHGFMSSPYMLRTLAKLYQSMGFLVYAILLPGHGTVPGELIKTSHIHWISAAEYGFHELLKRVNEIHLCGFSTGATLCGLLAQSFPKQVKSLSMFVPALGITPASCLLPVIHFLTYFLSDTSRLKWASRLKEHHLAAYLSTPYKGGLNVKRIIDRFHRGPLDDLKNIPTFITAIEKDGVVSIDPIHYFFKHYSSHQSQMLYYHSSEQDLPQDPRIIMVNDTTLQKNVLQLSHVSPIVPPNEPYYGEHGELYGPHLHPKTIFGEMCPANLVKPHFRRLSFNPDFNHLEEKFKQFLTLTMNQHKV